MYRLLPTNDPYFKYFENLCWLARICGRQQAVILVYLLIPWENDGHRWNFYFPKFQLRGCHGCRVMTRNVETENAPQNNLVISHRMRECRDAVLGFQCAWVEFENSAGYKWFSKLSGAQKNIPRVLECICTFRVLSGA